MLRQMNKKLIAVELEKKYLRNTYIYYSNSKFFKTLLANGKRLSNLDI